MDELIIKLSHFGFIAVDLKKQIQRKKSMFTNGNDK
jgi:hypothetical protein